MAFGAGAGYQTGYQKECQPGRQTEHTSRIRGGQQEVACECWFTSTGRMMPLMLKIKDEDGVYRTIRPVVVRSYEKKMLAGTPLIEFDCEITVRQRRMNVWLIYYQSENRWVLSFR